MQKRVMFILAPLYKGKHHRRMLFHGPDDCQMAIHLLVVGIHPCVKIIYFHWCLWPQPIFHLLKVFSSSNLVDVWIILIYKWIFLQCLGFWTNTCTCNIFQFIFEKFTVLLGFFFVLIIGHLQFFKNNWRYTNVQYRLMLRNQT